MINKIKVKRPSVDIILPTYNSDLFLLDRAIKSISDQEYQNWQLYVARDGGDIDISCLLETYNDPRISYLDLPHQGKAATLNSAIEKGVGEYIAYLDDDDLWYPNHLTECLAAIADAKSQFVHSDADEIWVQKQGETYKEKSRRVLNRGPISNSTLWYVSHISVVHTRALFQEAGPYNIDRNFFIDWDMFLRMAKHTSPLHLAKITCEHYMYLNAMNSETNTISSVHSRNKELSRRTHDEMFIKAFDIISAQSFLDIVKDWQRLNSEVEKNCRLRLDETESSYHLSPEFQHLRSEVLAMRGSLSWKITSPLRYVYDMLFSRRQL